MTAMKKTAKKKVTKRLATAPKTPRTKVPLRKHLEALSETALVDLLIEIAGTHGNVREELENRFSTEDQRVTKLKTEIARFRPHSNHYRDYGDSGTEDEVRNLIEKIRKTVDNPVFAMKLLVQVFEKDVEVMESANEDEDTMGDVFTHDATELFVELAKKIEDKKFVEDILCGLLPIDDYGTRDDLARNVRRYLPVANIRSLAARLCDSPRKKTGTYGFSSTRSLVRCLLETIGDPTFTKETLLAFDGSETPELCFEVGKAWFIAKNYVCAKEWLDKIPDGNSFYKTQRLEMFKTIHAKCRDKTALAETARELLKYKRTKENFEVLVKAVGEKQRAALLAEQIAEIEKINDVAYRDVEFLTKIAATDAAEDLLWRRLPELSLWGNEPLMLAKLMESKKRPLIATALYRKLVESILIAGKSKYYPTAITYMSILAKLATTIKDWKSLPPHKNFVENLKEKFPKRPSFWPNVK